VSILHDENVISPVIIRQMTVSVTRNKEVYVVKLCLVNPRKKVWRKAECVEVYHGTLEKATESVVRMSDGKKLFERIWTIANINGRPQVRIKETVSFQESGIREEILKKMLGK
jgi:hypothetical protein